MRLNATATALNLLAGGALARDRGAGYSKQEGMRLLRAHCEDMAQHLGDPESREETVEMLFARRCIRADRTIWLTD